MKNTLLFLLILCPFLGFTQENLSNYRKKRLAVKDSIIIDSVSINPSKFIIKTKDNKVLDSTLYTINFAKALIKFQHPLDIDTIEVEYLRYPKFLTQVYRQLDAKVIVDRSSSQQQLYRLENTKQNQFTPFDGLTTSGSISRGVLVILT